MKRIKAAAYILCLLLTACGKALPPEAPSMGGSGADVGSGGDTYAGEFLETAYELIEILKTRPIADLDAEALLGAVRKTRVVSRDVLELNGAEVDAINYANQAPPLIEMSRRRWDASKLARHERTFLVMHEYLNILGIEDLHYQVSRQLDRAHVCERSRRVREALEVQFKRSCFRILLDDLHHVSDLNLEHRPNLEKRVQSPMAQVWRLTDLVVSRDLNENDLILKGGDFASLYELRTLNLKGNGLKELPEGIFSDLGELEVLDLSRNSFKALPTKVFQPLSSLQRLNLTSNQLAELPTGLFQGIGPLTDGLDFSRNELVHLPQGFGAGLPPMFHFDLCNSERWGYDATTGLKQIDEGAFFGSPRFGRLKLCFQRGIDFSLESFRGIHAEELDILVEDFDKFPVSLFSTVDAVELAIVSSKVPPVEVLEAINANPNIWHFRFEPDRFSNLEVDRAIELFAPLAKHLAMPCRKMPDGIFCSKNLVHSADQIQFKD